MPQATVGIGVPVFNGEQYLDECLAGLSSQTYPALDIVVSDNASTDTTPDIVARWMRRDSRIRYERNRVNVGVAENFNLAFRRTRGTFFKWTAHDDICLPSYVERCVEALETDPDVVLAYPRPRDIDEFGQVLGVRDAGLDFGHLDPFERFRATMTTAHSGLALYGVTRTDVLRATGLHGRFHGGDRVLLAELALHGRFIEVPDELFLHREHADRASHSVPDVHALSAYYEPDRNRPFTFPAWKMLGSYLAAATRAPVSPSVRARCYVQMTGWAKGKRRALIDDVRHNAGVASHAVTGRQR